MDNLVNGTLDEDDLAVVGDLGERALDEVADADRLLPCWVLFLVRPSFGLLSIIICTHR